MGNSGYHGKRIHFSVVRLSQFASMEWIKHPKKISSGVDNWYLDEFFEEFICGRWYIYLEQTIYHLCRPISCWLSSLTVEYHLLWTINSYVAWYSSPADDIQRKQILIWRGWYSSRADNIYPMETIFIQERRISSMILVGSWNYNKPLEMIIFQLLSKPLKISEI
jgi:hypothetical protein